jgi:hypothetical protein
MNNVWFGVTSKSGDIFDKIISLVAGQDQIKWIDFSTSSSSNRIVFKAHSVPLKELCIVEAIEKFHSVGTCAIIAIIQDEACDTNLVVILVPNNNSMRCDVYVVPQQDVFFEAIANYNMNNVCGIGKNFSNNLLYHKIFLLSKVQFVHSSSAIDAASVWNNLIRVYNKNSTPNLDKNSTEEEENQEEEEEEEV